MSLPEILKIGSHGHIRLVDVMGSDESIVQAARISYGKGTKTVSEDRGLIRYLMRQRHTTPFEMCEIKIHVKCPMDVWRQWIRHRTASVNEYSTRYSEAIDDKAVTSEWRAQSGSNKQGSDGLIGDEWPEGYEVTNAGVYACERQWFISSVGVDIGTMRKPENDETPPTPQEYLKWRESQAHLDAKWTYEERLLFGVAKEQARKDLPLSTYTEAYWKCNLHNCLHFLSLRMDKHAQLEIREFANALGSIVKELFPLTWEAFEGYRLNAMYLTALDIGVIKELLNQTAVSESTFDIVLGGVENKRERAECEAKIKRLINIAMD